MGSRYLTDLADVCRRSGYPVIEVDDWQHRARGSGGYDSGRPNHVMIHHTASGASMDGWPDVNYCTFNDDDAPLCNIYLSRDGTIYVCAGGATNTNGSGHDPCGHTPDDSMNSSAIGIEAGNNGSGERWPDRQLACYLVLCGALCGGYGIPQSRVHSHWEWAPDRKVDPAGPPRPYDHGMSWDMNSFRADLGGGTIPIPPPSGDDDVEKYCVRTTDGYPWVTDFASYATAITEDQAARGRDMRGYIVGADGGPFPLDEQDSDLMLRLSGRP